MSSSMANPKKKETRELRKIIHCFKVGIAMTLVSLYYYYNPWSDNTTQGAAMWAVMTVVVVFEFTVGKFFLYISRLQARENTHPHACMLRYNIYIYIYINCRWMYIQRIE